MKQRVIAEACGVSRVSVGHWESSTPARRTVPSDEALEIISRLTGAPLEWLNDDGANIHPKFLSGLESGEVPGGFVEVPVINDGLVELLDYLLEHPHATAAEAAKEVDEVKQLAPIVISNELGQRLGETHSPRSFATFVLDKALEPCLLRDDLAIIDPDTEVRHGDIILMDILGARHGHGFRKVAVTSSTTDTVSLQAGATNDAYRSVDFVNLKIVQRSIIQTLRAALAEGGAHLYGRVTQTRRSLN